MLSFIPDEPQDRLGVLHRLEAIAHATTAVAFALTIVLVTTASARELNLVADMLFGTVGWMVTGVAAIGVITAAFWYYERRLEDYPRLMLAAGAVVALLGVFDLAANLWLLSQVGLPETVYWAEYGLATGVVLLVGVVAIVRHRLVPPTAKIIRNHNVEMRAIGIALLVVLSIVVTPFMGGISPNYSDHDGRVSASETGDYEEHIYIVDNDGKLTQLDPSDMSVVHQKSILSTTPSQGGVTNPGEGYIYATFEPPTSGSYADVNLFKIDQDTFDVVDTRDDLGKNTSSTELIHTSEHIILENRTNNNVVFLNPTNLTTEHSIDTGTSQIAELHYGEDGNVYVGTYGGELIKIDTETHSIVERNTIASSGRLGNIDLGSDGNLYLANGYGGSRAWKVNPSDLSVAVNESVLTQDGSGLNYVDGDVYVGDTDNVLRRLSSSDLTQKDSISTLSNPHTILNKDGDLHHNDDSHEITKTGVSPLSIGTKTAIDGSGGTTVVKDMALVGVPSDPVSGVVRDQSGDPVSNATVYATGYDAAAPPMIDGTPFDEIADDPLPDGWDAQTDTDWADQGQIDVEGADWDSTRVLMHSDEQWEIDHSWPDTRVFGKEIGPDPDLHPIPSTLSMEDKVVFSCWEPQSGFPDTFDDSMPGYETTPCDITIQRVDPTGDVQHETTAETKPAVKVTALSNLGSKEHHAYYAGDMSTGIYHVYPDDSPEAGIYYAIAPDGKVTKLESEIENWASSRSDAISQYNQEIKNEYDAGNLELASAKTNSTGHYSLDVPSQATKAELRVIKDGGENTATPGDLTRTDLRNEYDSAVRTNFDDATGVGFEDASEETFVDVCRRMDPVADDVGIPFHGSESTDIPNHNADIEGEYVIPKDLHPRVRKCAAISIVESLLDGDLGWLSPGLADNLKDLTDAELEEMLSTVQSMIGGNDVLCEEFADAIGAQSCEDAIEDPSDLTRGELENRVSEGYDTVDDSSDNMNGGGGGGIVGGGSGGVDVGDGDTQVGDETFSTDWNVGGVSDWNDAELMIRLTWSDGTTTVLNQSSEHVSIDESTLGADTVQLSEYPIGNEDPAAVQARLDVVTSSSTGSGDTRSVKNPTWNGDLPSLNSLKVSKWEPGEEDSFTVGVDEADSERFGALKRVEVTAPDGTTTTHDTIEDGEITAQTKTAGDHRVAVVFTANDDNSTEFTEVVQVRAGSTSKGRPPSIRGQSGAIGRYAVVGHGLDAGEVDVARGGSEVTMTGVLPQDADVPQTLTADTTDISISTDATTTVRLRRGTTRQTIRERINVVLFADEIDDDALVWRNGDALTRGGTQWGEVTVKNGTTVDTISDETASVSIRVNGDPSVVDRVRHWVSANVTLPSLPVGMAAFDVSPLLAALVALRRREPPEPPKPDVSEHRQPNPQEV